MTITAQYTSAERAFASVTLQPGDHLASEYVQAAFTADSHVNEAGVWVNEPKAYPAGEPKTLGVPCNADNPVWQALLALVEAGTVTLQRWSAPSVDLAAYAKARRYETEARGITVSGMAVKSAPDDQTRVANAFVGMQAAGAASISFKAADGFIDLTLDQVKAVGAALFAHTQACFAAESAVDARLNASPPTIASTAEVDAVFDAVPAAY